MPQRPHQRGPALPPNGQSAPGGSAPHTPADTGGPRRTAPRPQGNPQKADYRPGSAPHRVTRAQQKRQRRRRALLGALLVIAALAVGVALSFNVLFKVSGFRVQNLDGSQPLDAGIYTEEEILSVLNVQEGDNLFGFSTKEKQRQLAAQLPYLDEVQVGVNLPGTVVVKVRPATERFAVQTAAGWLVLNDERKILRQSSEQPQGVILLQANLPTDTPTLPGRYIKLVSYNSLLESEPDLAAALSGEATPEQAASDTVTADQVLDSLLVQLEAQGLLEGVTRMTLTDLSEVSFRYGERVQVQLGTVHNLEDKLSVAAKALLDVDGEGLGAGDRGILDVSYQRSDGEVWGYFRPGDPQEEPADPDSTAGEEEQPQVVDGTTPDGLEPEYSADDEPVG